MGFKDALKAAIGMESEDEIEVSEDEIAEEMDKMRGDEKPVAPMSQSRPETGIHKSDAAYDKIEPLISKGPQNKAYSMNGSGPFKMLVIEPKNFDECTKLVDNLKSRKPVIINLEHVETELARKMFDFLSGATYALNGNVQRVTSNIFIFAPANVDIAAKVNRESAEGGQLGAKSSPWR